MAAETAVVKAKKARAPPAHPPFVDMITEAIVALKERTGSSQYAITKYVEEKHKQLPQSFKKLLLLNLKKLVASGKLVKVKASFKLPPRASSSSTAAAAAPSKTKSEAAKAKKSTAKTAAVKPKANAKTAPKPKAVAAKPKAKAALTKAKSPKAKAAANPAAKAAKTALRTSPGKKVEPKAVKKPVKSPAVKKPKSVKSPAKKKPKSVKSPAKKKIQPKRGKK